MIRFVFLDLDDTLLDFHRSEEQAIKKTEECRPDLLSGSVGIEKGEE